jgi:hypothetical protein
MACDLLITTLREHRLCVYENKVVTGIFATRRQQESSKHRSREFPKILEPSINSRSQKGIMKRGP